MYEITIRKTFSAAHALKEVGGQCEDLHGHNFTVDVSIAGDQLNSEDLLIDFRVLKGWINEIFSEIDHKYLNNLDSFKDINPSSERIAKLIHDRLKNKASAINLRISSITVWESDDARVIYKENETG